MSEAAQAQRFVGGKGWKKDRTQEPGHIAELLQKHLLMPHRSAKGLLGAPTQVPASADLSGYVDQVLNQGATNSCVGHALAMGTFVRCAAMGKPIAMPSPMCVYAGARALERQQLGLDPAAQPLVDEGAQPMLGYAAMAEVGICSQAEWPLDAARVNEEPRVDLLEEASAFTPQGYHRIDTLGSSRLADVRNAIASGYPVGIGLQIDQAFEDYVGRDEAGNVLVCPAPSLSQRTGGHMLLAVAYGYQANVPAFLIVNSWGKSWGLNGFVWVTEGFVSSQDDADVVVASVAPYLGVKLSGAARAQKIVP